MDTVRIDSTTPLDPRARRAQDPDSGWAAGSHLIALCCSILGAIVVAIIVGKHSPFVRQHARQAVNFQVNLLVAALLGALLTAITPAFLLAWVPLAIAALVMPIVAAVRANRGEWQPYPPLVPFLRSLPAPVG